jgi:endonuclease/exonuclease/phosphatase (EEP) superfamily protein YafD
MMPKKADILRHARLGVTAWATASAAIAIASIGAAAFAPFDLLNHIAPFWLAFNAAGVMASWFVLAPGKARLVMIGAFGFALMAHAALISPEFVRPIPAAVSPDPNAPRVRIVWLNAQSGTAGESVREYLLSTDADFVLLAEFHAEAGMVTPELAEAYPHWSTCNAPHACNVIVLSRTAPVSARPEHEASPSGLRVVWADFDVGGAPLRLVATHLQRPYPAARQAAQRAELVTILASASAEDTILAGDFNSTPWSFALRRIDAAGGLTRYDRAMTTWPAASWTRLRLPAPVAFMPIDHVYAGGNWRLVSIRRGPRTGADHFPIEAEFVWTGGAG